MDILDPQIPKRKRGRIPSWFILVLVGIAVIAIVAAIYGGGPPSTPAPSDSGTNEQQNVTIYSTLDSGSNSQSMPAYQQEVRKTPSQYIQPIQTIPNQSPTPTRPSVVFYYPTANQTLINDPAYHTPLAIIQWNVKSSNGTTATLDLEDQSGTVVKTIANNIPNTGMFAWFSDSSIPNSMYSLRIRTFTTGSMAAEGVSNAFTLASPSSSQHPTEGVWSTYINPQYKFSFTYPQNILFTSFKAQSSPLTLTALQFTLLDFYFHSTDPANQTFIMPVANDITVSVRADTAAACTATLSTPSQTGLFYMYGNSSIFQGLYERFTKTEWGSIDTQAQRRTDTRIYRVFHNNVCYSIQFAVTTADSSGSNWGVGTLYQAQKYLTVVFAMVDQLVSSFRFL